MLKKISVLSALIAAFVLFTLSPQQQAFAAAGEVYVDFHGPTIDHNGVYDGETFQVDVIAEQIMDADGLAAGSFDLDYDESVLSVHTTVSNDPQIGATLSGSDCNFLETEDDAINGILSVAFVCNTPLDISTATNVILATIIFDQSNPPGADSSVDFQVSSPFLNDGSTPLPQPIDTGLADPGPVVTLNIFAGTCGDQDSSDTVNTIDATIDAFFAIGTIATLSDEQHVLSDVMRDGAVNVGDVIMTLQHIVGSTTITGCGPVDPTV